VVPAVSPALDLQSPVSAPDPGGNIGAPVTSIWSSPFDLQLPAGQTVADSALQDPVGATEIPSLRTRDTKTYAKDNGEKITRLFEGSVNYRDDLGDWKTIDNTLVPASSPGYAYRNKANRYEAEFPQDLSTPVRFTLNKDSTTMALEGARGAGVATANKARFPNALPGVTVEYAAGNDALKESLILERPGVAQSFDFFIRTSSGLSAHKSDDGTIDFERDGRKVFSLAAPVLWDGSGSLSAVSPDVDVKLEKLSDGYRVTLTPDQGWLSSPKRVWPVVLDPTIYLSPGGECTIYQPSGGPKPNPVRRCRPPNYPWDEVGSNGTAGSIVRSLFRFDLAPIPGDATVTSATFGAYAAYMPRSPAGATVMLHRLSRDWDSGVSWTTTNGASPWDHPGGDFDAVPVATDVVPWDGSVSVDRWRRWTVTQLVQDWLRGAVKNQGMILKTPEATAVDDYTAFYSSSFGAFMPSFWSQFWPYLEVKWKPQGRYASTPDKTWVVDGGNGDTPRVNAIKTLDKTVYVGGDFSAVGPRTGSFASLKASSDASYEPSIPEVAGTAGTPAGGAVPVRAIASDGSGGWYIGGEFKYIGDRPWPRLAHIKADGTLDQNWRPEPNGDVWALTVSGTSLYVGGQFTVIGGENRSAIAKLTASSGEVDTSWNAQVDDGSVRAIVVAGADAMYIGGTFTSLRGGAYPRTSLAGLDPASGLPLSLNRPVHGTVSALALSGATLYVGGSFSSVGGLPLQHLARINTTSEVVDGSWPSSAPSSAVDALQLGASRLFVGGSFGTIATQSRNGLASFTLPGGGIDTWNPQPANGTASARVRALASSGSTLYVGGDFTSIGGQSRRDLAALDTTVDAGTATNWNPALGNAVYAIALCSGTSCQNGTDHVAAAGAFRSANVVLRQNLLSLNADTGIATSWDPGPDGPINALELARGGLYVGGSFSKIGTKPGSGRTNIALFLTKPGPEPMLNAWRPSVGAVTALHATPGNIYVGSKTPISFPGGSSSYVGAWSLDTGNLVAGWNPHPDGPVDAIEDDANIIYLGGSFTLPGPPGQATRHNLASVYGPALPPCDSSPLPSDCPQPGSLGYPGVSTPWWPEAFGGPVHALVVSNGRIYVGGEFTVIAGDCRYPFLASFPTAGGGGNLAAWTPPDISPDPCNHPNPSTNGSVDSLDADGSAIYVGGRFNLLANQPRSGLGALDPLNGGIVAPFSPSAEVATGWGDASGSVRALNVTDGKLWAGGDWYGIGSAAQSGIAAFPAYGYVTEPAQATMTRRRLTLSARSDTTSLFNRFRFEYRRLGANNTSETWATIPRDLVRDTSNSPIGDWPLPVPNGVTPTVVWDMPPTVRNDVTKPNEHGINYQDGDVQVRAVFVEPNGNEYQSAPITVTLKQNAPGTADATQSIGPGSLDLANGNYSITRDDVSQTGANSDLTFSRTYNSRDPNAGADGPFGKGWLSSLPVDAAQAAYASLDVQPIPFDPDVPADTYDRVTITGSDGTKFTFIYVEGQFWPEPGSEDLQLTTDGAFYWILDTDGNTTKFRPDGNGPNGSHYIVAEVRQPGSGNATSYDYEPGNAGKLRIKRLFPPGSTADICAPDPPPPGFIPPPGCRYLWFQYYDCSCPESQGKLAAVWLRGFDTDQNREDLVEIEEYHYDQQSGRLVRAYDMAAAQSGVYPVEEYDYDATGHLTSLRPPGEVAWEFSYSIAAGDPNSGRLFSLSRQDPNFGPAITTRIHYQVALTGQGAPYDLSSGQIANWAQADIPTDATAIYPPSATTEDLRSAFIHYMDRYGRETNIASPGSDPNGYITTSEWDGHNNQIRTLSAQNRLTALASSSPPDVAKSLDVQHGYTADGVDLKTELGSRHMVKLANGDESPARQKTSYSYDAQVPVGLPQPHLLTKVTTEALLDDNTEADARTTETSYFDDGVDKGLRLRLPTTIRQDDNSAGQDLVTSIRYNDKGLETQRTAPGGSSSPGTDPHTTQTVYYTAASQNGPDQPCGNRIEWQNLPCIVRPAAQPDPNKQIPVKKFNYNTLYLVSKETDTVRQQDGTVKAETVKTMQYDPAGRLKTTSVSATGASAGTPVPDVSYTYDDYSEKLTTTSSGAGQSQQAVRREYDPLGRLFKYTDAAKGVTTTEYDIFGRRQTLRLSIDPSNNTIGLRTFYYYTQTGLVSSTADGAAGDFTNATYNADGQLTSETYPNGLVATTTYDATGSAMSLQYAKGSAVWLEFHVIESIHGQWRKQDSTFGHQEYKYDQFGRLTTVYDTMSGLNCHTRSYSYDRASNRLEMGTAASSSTTCQNSTSPSETYSYDSADRLTNSGVSYDDYGRLTTLPAQYAGGTSSLPIDDLNTSYYANGLVKSQSQGGVTNDYSLDPLMRQAQRTETYSGVEIYHYSDDSDSPSWVTSSSEGTSWARNVSDIAGNLAEIHRVSLSDPTELQLSNLHGDIVATCSPSSSGSGLTSTSQSDEFGVPIRNDAPPKYSWLGAKGRRTELPSGLVQMGVRSYVPQLGRFLQTDPVRGGSVNAYDYASGDPVNSVDVDGTAPKPGDPPIRHTCEAYIIGFEAPPDSLSFAIPVEAYDAGVTCDFTSYKPKEIHFKVQVWVNGVNKGVVSGARHTCFNALTCSHRAITGHGIKDKVAAPEICGTTPINTVMEVTATYTTKRGKKKKKISRDAIPGVYFNSVC
jgi:RHS repeat-associated protein